MLAKYLVVFAFLAGVIHWSFCSEVMERSEIPYPIGHWQAMLTLEGTSSSRAFPNVRDGEGYTEGTVISLPFSTGHVFVDPSGAGGINFEWLLADGGEARAQLKFSHLEAEHPYHLAIDWNLKAGLLRIFVNGVQQGDLFHGREYPSLMPASWQDPVPSGGHLKFEGIPVAKLNIAEVALDSTLIDPVDLLETVSRLNLPPLGGEFRQTYTEPLRLDGLTVDRLYSTRFKESEGVVFETALLDERRVRSREPGEGDWVLEGDQIEVETVFNGLRLRSRKPGDKRDGSLVLWHNLELPDDFLIEYAFTPERSDSGLNILFFNAKGADGGSIFALGQPPRHGRFRSYIVGSIDNYHVSPWATDEHRLRKSSNLRKNSGFNLLAIGDERIGQLAFGKTHLVRVLKVGGKIMVEADGIKVMEYVDDGTVHGPVYHQGIAGIRFMSHTGTVTLHNYTLYHVHP